MRLCKVSSSACEITLYVIYKTTNRRHAEQYAQLARVYAADGRVRFVEETDFRQDVLRVLAARGPNGLAEQLLFLVDDTLFVRDFRLAEIRETLANHPEALGFSLRLGANVTYRYTADETQAVPALTTVRGQIRSFDWTTAQGYFHYPLEVSSSVFRIEEHAYPDVVLRELTVNALCHRDWSQDGSRVRIQMLPNCIEWISPGSLPPGVTLQNLRTAQVSRNRALAQMLFHAGYVEEFGIGIDTVFDTLRDAKHDPPWLQDDGHFLRSASSASRSTLARVRPCYRRLTSAKPALSR